MQNCLKSSYDTFALNFQYVSPLLTYDYYASL